jgi:hypothetical protein
MERNRIFGDPEPLEQRQSAVAGLYGTQWQKYPAGTGPKQVITLSAQVQ